MIRRNTGAGYGSIKTESHHKNSFPEYDSGIKENPCNISLYQIEPENPNWDKDELGLLGEDNRDNRSARRIIDAITH